MVPADPKFVCALAARAIDAPALSTPADQTTVDSAVAFLNQAMQESGFNLATVVSDYVVLTFFDGDPAKLGSHDRHRAHTYRALCKHPQLEMGAAAGRRRLTWSNRCRR